MATPTLVCTTTGKTALKRESPLRISYWNLDKNTDKEFLALLQQFTRVRLEAPPQLYYDLTIREKNPHLSLTAKSGKLAEPLALLDLPSSLSPSGNQFSMTMASALSTPAQKLWTKLWSTSGPVVK